jgi:flagellar basal-body rod modification protein FlgD
MTTSIASVGSTAPTSSSGSKASQLQDINSNQFLTLLVAQMRNQDPMQPSDPSAFLSQLAQFSTVTSVTAMKDSMSELVTTMRSSQMFSGAQLVGRDVLALASNFDHDGQAVTRGAVEVPAGLESATVNIKDSTGTVVRRMPISTTAGLVAFEWDGKNDSGLALGAGRYSWEVQGKSSLGVETLAPMRRNTVSSVTFDPAKGDITLNTSQGALPMTSVRRVL